MTTSEPQADRRDDDPGEHRTIGQRIRDAVLGEEPDDRRGRDTGYADPDDGRHGHAEHDTTDPGHAGADHLGTGRAHGDYADPDRFDETVHGAGSPASEHIRSADLPPYAGSPAGGTELADPDARGSSADAGRGDLFDDGTDRGDAVRHEGHRDDSYRDDGYRDEGYAGTGNAAGATADEQGRFDEPRVTGGGDEPAAAHIVADDLPGRGDGDRDESYRDEGVRHDAGYDPAGDTGYVDERRAEVDATTGDRDADYDTGRVDRGPDADHGSFGPGTAGLAAGGVAAAGAAAAATHSRRTDDRDDRTGDGRSDDTRFSAVDDTGTVDATPTGRATDDARTGGDRVRSGDPAAEQRAEAVAADDASRGGDGRERLVPADRAREYSTRWDALKGDFVDEPRRAVAQADGLVGELLDEIQRVFTDQRRELEQGFAHDDASTEDLRLALRRYRSFFDRLLSF